MEKVIEFMHKFLGNDSKLTDSELSLYKLALTHGSNNTLVNHNQRLALIGDSVLRLIIREHVYNLRPHWTKGKITEIAAGTGSVTGIEEDETYAPIAISIKVLDYMDIQNQSFEADNITTNAEAFEALFGAVYLTRGLKEAERLALKYINFNKLPYSGSLSLFSST